MKNLCKIYNSQTLIILAVLASSTFLPALAFGAPLANSAENWQYTNGNSWAWNYSPETQITKDNIEDIEVKWIFPLESKSTVIGAMQPLMVNEGTTTPPIIQDGKVMVTSNFLRTYAVDAGNGEQLWVHNYNIDPDDIQERLPVLLPNRAGFLGVLNAHLHGIRYWESGNSLLINGQACDFYGIDIDSGETSFHVKDLCANIPGNMYSYRQGTANTDGVATYEKGRQFIYVLPGLMHMFIYEGDARHVTMGIDMDTEEILWRIFSFPPQGVLTKDWALQECDIGFFQDIPCSTVAAQAPENLEWDWAEPNEPPSVFGGVTANWGSTPVVDEDTGILYTQTGNQGPFTYVGATPGPRLYGSTIMAIDLEQGTRLWWLQPNPRDMYDYDCDWDGILVDDPTLGKVYVKGCKEGMLYVMDAATGKPLYVKDVIEEQIEQGQITDAAATEPFEGGIRYHLGNPLSYYDMREMVSPENSNYCGAPCPLYPWYLLGIFATDMSYEPETGTLYHYASAQQGETRVSPPPEINGATTIGFQSPNQNTTIIARDLATGNVKWTWFYEVSQQRAHMIVTPELIIAGFTDGYMRFFDKDIGELVFEKNIGSDLRVGPTTGQDSDGNQMIYMMVGTGASGIFPSLPGTLIALGLSERTQTSTTVTGSTTIATTTTVTETSEVTETEGFPATYTYTAVAIAVLAVIGAAILTTRRRP